VAEARYKGQVLHDLRTNVRIAPDATVADPVTCRVGEGTLEGTARLLKGAEGGPDTAAVMATFIDVDAAVIDALLFDEPRGLGGRFTGNADLRFAVAEDLPPTHTLDGTVAFDAVDGTYGKARSATKLLSLLKTTEVLWGRLPTLRDEGLTYDTSQGRLSARNGVLDINTFSLASKSYALSAEGRVNFPEDRMNVEAQFRILESVRNVLGMVPVIGSAVGQLDDRGGLRIQFTGSPQDPQASIITPRERLREGVGNLLDRAPERLGR
jgi:hypothetical protein